MKTLRLITLFIIYNLTFSISFAQNVGINTTGVAPNSSALLDVDAAPLNNKGLLIPRIALTSATDAVTIATPATSLLVYNVGTGGLTPAGYYYNSGTSVAPVWIRFTTDACNQSVPSAQWPTFDATSPYVLLGALWVGYDAVADCWKYNKQTTGRGLVDPGNPSTWTVNGSTINYFDGELDELPSGTHANNRYNPKTMAAKYVQDDFMVKVGSFWIDKYESRIIDVSTGLFQDNDNTTTPFTPADGDIRGNGQGIPPTWMAFSQKALGSSGMSWFVAQATAANAGKKIVSNAEWQAAAKGTNRTDATGMTVGGETWATVANQDISQFGVVGMVGSLWEWVGDWGQYGPDNGVTNGVFIAYPAPYNADATRNIAGVSWTKVTGGWVIGIPTALLRGGSWDSITSAGVFAVGGGDAPSSWDWSIGFRAVR